MMTDDEKMEIALEVAPQLHADWLESKRAQGVTTRPSPAGHEQILDWEDLHPDVKDDNIRQALTAIEAIGRAGYRIAIGHEATANAAKVTCNL